VLFNAATRGDVQLPRREALGAPHMVHRAISPRAASMCGTGGQDHDAPMGASAHRHRDCAAARSSRSTRRSRSSMIRQVHDDPARRLRRHRSHRESATAIQEGARAARRRTTPASRRRGGSPGAYEAGSRSALQMNVAVTRKIPRAVDDGRETRQDGSRLEGPSRRRGSLPICVR
jgi:hypothetical protein